MGLIAPPSNVNAPKDADRKESDATNQTTGPVSLWPMDRLDTAMLLGFLAVVYGHLFYVYFSAAHGWFDANGNLIGRDFAIIWLAAKTALNGHVLDLFDITRFHLAQEALLNHAFPLHVWSYPPNVLPWIVGFGLFSYPVGLAIWTLGTLAAYLAALAIKRPQPWLIVAAFVLAPCTIENAWCGQTGFLAAALLVGAVRLRPSRPILAGILFGFLTLTPQLGLMAPVMLLVTRDGKTLLWAVLTALALIGLSVALYGPAPWIAYIRVTVPEHRHLMATMLRQYASLMMPSAFMAVRLWGGSATLAFGVSAVCALGAACAVAYAYVRKTWSEAWRRAVFLSATLVATPYLHSYDLTLLGAAILAFLAAPRAWPLERFEKFALLAAWILPIMVVDLNLLRVTLSPAILVAVLLLSLRRAAKTPPQTPLRDVLERQGT